MTTQEQPACFRIAALLRDRRALLEEAGGWASGIPPERLAEWKRRKRELLREIEGDDRAGPAAGDAGK